ncbi:transposable element tc3 transposase [Trichonephila clavipes]|nr:transposable element tc3 transposase [Trichonephila clavipes]
MQKGPLTVKNLRLMVTKFEKTESLNVRSGRGRKPVFAEAIERVALQVEEHKASNVRLVQVFAMWQKHWICLVQLTRRSLSCETSSVTNHTSFNLCRNCFHMISRLDICSLCSFSFVWKLIQNGLGISSVWTDEEPFHLDGSVNTHNCQIWESDNPHSTLQVPLHSPKVTVWCGFSTSFILGPYFFEEIGAGGPVTCYITGQRYASLLRNKIIPDLQAHQCFSRIIFLQDGIPPHITRCVKDVLKHHFTEERMISRQIRHLWPPRSPDLNTCDFWLWGHLKQLVSCDEPRTLPDLKDSISRHVLNISLNTLRSTVEHAILRFQIVAENDGHHVEHL